MAHDLPRLTPPGFKGEPRYLWFLFVAIAAILPVGCQPAEEITTYDTPKPDTRETEGKNRLLAAVFLHDATAWYFKFVGPAPQMKEHERAFLDFLQTVRFSKQGQPTWTVPEGWQRGPNRPSRFAAFQIGKEPTALELTVVPLPAAEGDVNLLINVNRWRRQLHRQNIDEAALDHYKRTLVVDGKEVPLVDLTGSGSGKTPRKADEPEVIEVNPSSLKKYDTPSGWVETKEQDPGAAAVGVRREAAFKVSEGGAMALVTVIPMANAGPADLRSNIDLWASHLGLKNLTKDQIADMLKEFSVDGIEHCVLVDMVGPKGGTLAVVVPLSDKLWVFKMTGPAALVISQKAKFEAFVKSAKFEGGR